MQSKMLPLMHPPPPPSGTTPASTLSCGSCRFRACDSRSWWVRRNCAPRAAQLIRDSPEGLAELFLVGRGHFFVRLLSLASSVLGSFVGPWVDQVIYASAMTQGVVFAVRAHKTYFCRVERWNSAPCRVIDGLPLNPLPFDFLFCRHSTRSVVCYGTSRMVSLIRRLRQ